METWKGVSEAVLRPRSDAELLALLVEMAEYYHDGHLTILKFTTNWRVGFVTPNSTEDIEEMAVGGTFNRAAQAALRRMT